MRKVRSTNENWKLQTGTPEPTETICSCTYQGCALEGDPTHSGLPMYISWVASCVVVLVGRTTTPTSCTMKTLDLSVLPPRSCVQPSCYCLILVTICLIWILQLSHLTEYTVDFATLGPPSAEKNEEENDGTKAHKTLITRMWICRKISIKCVIIPV